MRIGKNLKKLAFELGVPRIFVVRFYAEWKEREGRRPSIQELRGALTDYIENAQPRQESPRIRVQLRGRLPKLV